MLTIEIGTDSEGNVASRDLCVLKVLFVSYIEETQLSGLIKQLIERNSDLIENLLMITKEPKFPFDISVATKIASYIYNNPGEGTIKEKGKLFSMLYSVHKKRLKLKSKQVLKSIIYIDDMWQFCPRIVSRNSIKQFKELLENGHKTGIYLVIGSILPYRNLLLQLMNYNSTGRSYSVFQELGSELLFNSEELIFFKEPHLPQIVCYKK